MFNASGIFTVTEHDPAAGCAGAMTVIDVSLIIVTDEVNIPEGVSNLTLVAFVNPYPVIVKVVGAVVLALAGDMLVIVDGYGITLEKAVNDTV